LLLHLALHFLQEIHLLRRQVAGISHLKIRLTSTDFQANSPFGFIGDIALLKGQETVETAEEYP